MHLQIQLIQDLKTYGLNPKDWFIVSSQGERLIFENLTEKGLKLQALLRDQKIFNLEWVSI